MKKILYLFTVLSVMLFTSCEKGHAPRIEPDAPQQTDDPDEPGEEFGDSIIHLTVFYTSDEHGWMEATDSYDGAAGLAGMWNEDEGYDGSENYLILSGGDMWSGPAISTWFQGQSMVEVMNGMEYDAAAIGNHEFDFKVEGLESRLTELDFPLLSANIIERSSGEIPGFAKPYIIKEIDGIKVGIIGLSSLSTPTTTFPTNVENYRFTSYAEAVEKYAVKAKDEGAVVLLLIGHLCSGEMGRLVPVAKAHDICLIGGGHCHSTSASQNDGVVLIEAGSNMRAYVKVTFDYVVTDSLTRNFDYQVVNNTMGEEDPEVQEIIDYWSDQTEAELAEPIGYTNEVIRKSSPAMGNMVCDSWLHYFNDADVSLTNSGGIRQDIPEGAITLETIVGLLPFENTLIALELTGSELLEVADGLLMGGMQTANGNTLMDGTPIESNSTYTLITTDYLYSLSNNNLSRYDDTPTYTNITYRQPLIDWLKSINTTPADPLRNYLDDNRRY